MPDFLRGFSETFSPAFQRMYGQSYALADEELQQKAKLAQQKQLAEQQQGGFRKLLKGGLTPEEEANTFAGVGNEYQQAYSLFQKLKAPEEVKYSNVFREGGKQFGLNKKGERVEIGGVPLPQEEPTYIYDPTLPNVMKQDPKTKQLIPTDIINPKYKKPTYEKEVRRKYDPKTDKMQVEIGTYEKGSTEPIKTDIRYLDVKESGMGGSKLKKEVTTDLDQQENEIIRLANSTKQKITGVKVDSDGIPYIVTPQGNVPISDYQQSIKKDLWKKSNSFTSEIKNMLSEKGKKFLRELYNTEIKNGNNVVKRKGEKPNLSDFSSSLADWWKNGEIDEADYKLLKYYRTGTYHGVEE